MHLPNRRRFHWAKYVRVCHISSGRQIVNSLPSMPIEGHKVERSAANCRNEQSNQGKNDPGQSSDGKSGCRKIDSDCEERIADEGLRQRNGVPSPVNNLQVHDPLTQSLPISNFAVQNHEIRKGNARTKQGTPHADMREPFTERKSHRQACSAKDDGIQAVGKEPPPERSDNVFPRKCRRN